MGDIYRDRGRHTARADKRGHTHPHPHPGWMGKILKSSHPHPHPDNMRKSVVPISQRLGNVYKLQIYEYSHWTPVTEVVKIFIGPSFFSQSGLALFRLVQLVLAKAQ